VSNLRHAALQFAIISIVVFIAISAPLPAGRQIAVGTVDAQAYLEHFWLPEQNELNAFRWTDGEGIIWLHDYASAEAVLVTLRLTRPGSADSTPVNLTLRSDEQTIGTVPVTADWRTYHLLLAPKGIAWRTPNIDLLSPTFRAGTNDLRRLGVVVSAITLTPVGQPLALFLLLRALYLATLVVLVQLGLRIFYPARYAHAISFIVGVVAALLWRLDPTGIDQRMPSPWHMALGASCVALILVYSAHWHRAPAPSGAMSSNAPHRLASILLIGPIAIMVIITALLSLQWRMLHDSPLLMYMAFLIDRFHAVPYRDIFDQNMPGALAVYLLVGRLFGYGDQGFRSADLIVLTLLSVCTWVWCRRINARYAVLAVMLFNLLYLNYGPGISMQRDYVLLLPIAASLAVSVSSLGRSWRLFLAGFLFGLAVVIKPHAGIGFPFLLLFLLTEHSVDFAPPRRHLLFSAIGIALLGLMVPVAACVIYLYSSGASSAFLDMVVNYLPLFAQITGSHQTIAGMARVRYLFNGYLAFGNHHAWLVTALVGAAVALRWGRLERSQRRQVLLMLAFALGYSLYPLAQGRFWDYHWLPCLYALALLSALCVLPQPEQPRLIGHMLPPIVLVLAIAWRIGLPSELSYQLRGHPLPPIKAGRVDQITSFLEERIRPGETVQPLDWTGGALHGMLNAGVPIATPFIYNFQFYHHVSTPYIQGLRARFITDIGSSRPQFIIDMGEYNTLITGDDTTTTFPELQKILGNDYVIAFQGNGYFIYERK
jgi:hypothetical protein